MDKKQHLISKIISAVPWWNLLRILSIGLLAALIIWPFIELQAMQSSVVFYKGNYATLAWDPPAQGVVDHYVIEVTTTRVMDGPSNAVTWVDYYTSKEEQYKIQTLDGYTYAFRVKAVGPAGNESPYSEERLTVVCDCSEPCLNITPIDENKKIRGRTFTLTGTFTDSNLAAIEVNGEKALLDFASGTWQVTIPLDTGSNSIAVTAYDYAGNSFRQEFQLWQQPVVVATDPVDGDIFIMGSPAYPGIYLSSESIRIYDVIDPCLHFSVTAVKKGFMQSGSIISFPEGQDTITLPMKRFRPPSGFSSHPLDIPALQEIHEMPFLFTADTDQDSALEIMLAYPDYGKAFMLENSSGKIDDSWKAEPLEFMSDSTPEENAVLYGQPFYIDYDWDFRYETVATMARDGQLHIFEWNGKEWIAKHDRVVKLPGGYSYIKNFGFLDWDHDRKKDIFFRLEGEEIVHILPNSGTDASPQYKELGSTYTLSDLNPISPISVCDWNGDIMPDFLGQDKSGSLCVWISQAADEGMQFIKTILPVTIPAGLTSTVAADWNNDGIYDIIAAGDTGNLFILIGEQE